MRSLKYVDQDITWWQRQYDKWKVVSLKLDCVAPILCFIRPNTKEKELCVCLKNKSIVFFLLCLHFTRPFSICHIQTLSGFCILFYTHIADTESTMNLKTIPPKLYLCETGSKSCDVIFLQYCTIVAGAISPLK